MRGVNRVAKVQQAQRVDQLVERATTVAARAAVAVAELRERRAQAAATDPRERMRRAIALSDLAHAKARLARVGTAVA
jgi:hypothetical protein